MIVLVAGTRPEIIKLVPVYRQLRQKRLDPVWLYTGQQPDLAEDTFKVFAMKPEVELDLERSDGSLGELNALLATKIGHAVKTLSPDMIVVQGDTLSAAVGAQVGFLAQIPVAHVEAGLRSMDLASPFPEEACRVWIDSIADLKFAPTEQARLKAQLINPHGKTYVTGNTVMDALSLIKRKPVREGRYAVVTLHRRENASSVLEVCRAVKELADRHVFDYVVWPVHPNPTVRDVVPKVMGKVRNVETCAPLAYGDMINLVRGAQLLLTDSGGLQEEALGLHVPCLILRKETERPEGVQAGGARIVGCDRKKIVGWASWLMQDEESWLDMATALNPYGDGKAAERIAVAIQARLKGQEPAADRVMWSGV